MISATIQKAAETISRLDALRKKMAVSAYLKKKRTAQDNRQRIKERQAAEKLIERALQPFFVDQIESAAKALAATVEGIKSAQQALPTIFNPADWNQKLIDTLYPAMVKIAVVGMDGEMRRMGLQIKRGFAEVKESKEPPTAKSTATDLLNALDDSGGLLDMGILDTPYGPVNMSFLFEYPDWMKQAITEFLNESFSQPYWDELNKTTQGDIEKYLQEGIKDGWSIERMANEMAPQLLETGRYAKIRGRNIARTEAGHALNGARSMGIDSVVAELQGTGLDIQKLWHSVRGTTTRDDHRAIHGVPADQEGMWTLGGARCRWPGDTSLPANQRCNCQCTIETAFGMSDSEARELIRVYEGRMAKASWAKLRVKVFCPTGPGGGVDSSCGKEGKKERSPLLDPVVILGSPPVGQEEFISYLEKHGQEFTSAPKPKGIKKGVMKQCYMNATKLAIAKRELTYVEGIAYTPKLGKMAVSHAWVVDKDGKVIDNTWDEPENCQYFGVPVPTTRLEMWMVKTKVYGIFGGADKASRELIMSGEKP